MAHINSDILRLGVDVGSTTVKAVALDPADNSVLFTRYQRHNAHQADTVRQLLEEAAGHFPGMRFRIGVCGSGGRPIAAALGTCYVQEVVANAAAVRALYPEVRTAVELGGQDAKVIFFRYDEASGKLQTSDMRMNGSCAGGTGAFIDEIAALLNVPADEFEQLAARGKTVYSISGRCGVFAKTDIQPLLIQGAERADIALSTFHAIAKQTIGGLSQGLELTAPIIFEGGPLTFNPTLVRVFAERLNLEERDIVRPDHPETIVARGTAIAIDELFPGQEDAMTLAEAMERLDKAPAQTEGTALVVRQGQIFQHGEVGAGAGSGVLVDPAHGGVPLVVLQLGDAPAAHQHVTALDGDRAADDVQQGGLAAAIAAHDGHELALLHCQGEVLEQPLLRQGAGVVDLRDVPYFKHG